MADKHIVYFDLETRKTAGDVGGWGNEALMGISVAVTFSTLSGKYHIYEQDDVDALVDQLVKADLVVGFNHIKFDYSVLMGLHLLDLRNSCHSLDLLIDLEKRLGHRLKLDSVAAGTFGYGKTADGLEAIKWWREGKLRQIAEYCCFDVKLTKMVHEFGAQHGYVKYFDRAGQLREVEVDWSLF